MIRVLHIVTNMRRGGLETMIMNYYRHIDRSKVQFDFLVHRDYESDYDCEILRLGGRIYHVSRLIPWSNSYRRIICDFFTNHPEYRIIHVHQDCLSSVVLECAKRMNIPVRIAHSHSSSQDKNWKYIVKLYYMRSISKYATDLFACGKAAGDWMFCGNPYKIVRNAIEIEKYEYSNVKSERIRKQFHLNNEIVIGHVGRFTNAKNHKFLVDVFNECVKLSPNVKLLLVGDGENQQTIKKKVKKYKLQNKVVFTGAVEDTYNLMQAMDIFVFPSLYEGLPLTMIEAQASGLPCVISDKVPQECIITNGLVTYCKLEEKPVKWANIIMKKLRYSRINHSKELGCAGYDINVEAKKLEEYYINHFKEVDL